MEISTVTRGGAIGLPSHPAAQSSQFVIVITVLFEFVPRLSFTLVLRSRFPPLQQQEVRGLTLTSFARGPVGG